MFATATPPVPPKNDARWNALVAQGTTRPIKLLALKLMLSRMNQDLRRDPSPAITGRNVDELHQFFVTNARMVAADAAVLFG